MFRWNISFVVIFLMTQMLVFAQVPEQFSYQAIVRNSNGELIRSSEVGIRISILQGSESGTELAPNEFTQKTNANGLLSLMVDVRDLDWALGPFFIKTQVDPEGGSNYTISGTTPIGSVPYALHAKVAENLVNMPENLSDFNNDMGYLTSFTEVDGDPNNEIQDLSWASPHVIQLSKSDATLDLSQYLDDTDTHIDSAGIAEYGFLTKELDGDSTNELQTIEFLGDSLLLVSRDKKDTSYAAIPKISYYDLLDRPNLENLRCKVVTVGGNQRHQVVSNYGSYDNVRRASLTVSTSGYCVALASGYLDWESTGWDLYLGGILMDQDPNSSWAAENEWYSYLNIVTDYNCPDSSDQYTSMAQHRTFSVGAGTHTFTLWVNKYTSSSKTELGDVNLTVIFIPTGSYEGYTKSAELSLIKVATTDTQKNDFSENVMKKIVKEKSKAIRKKVDEIIRME